jgi:hypothetical protein
MVTESAAFIMRKNERRTLPSRALHQGINQLLRIRNTLLDVTRGMLIQTKFRCVLNEHHFWQVLVGRRTRQDFEVIADGKYFAS